MRWGSFVIGILFLSLSCGERTPRYVKHYEIIYPELHLGEYLQQDQHGNLVSVVRTPGERQGLVRLDPITLKIEVLDAAASDAKNILVSENFIAYRVDNKLQYYDGRNSYIVNDLQITKLKSFEAQKSYLLFGTENLSGETELSCVDLNGGDISQISLEAKILFQQNQSYLIESSKGLEIVEIGDCPSLEFLSRTEIELNVETQYAAFEKFKSHYYIAYLNENDGTLIVLRLDENYRVIKKSRIDGSPQETYIGMDLKFFKSSERLGLIYMDGWKLDAKLALLKTSDEWEVRDLEVQGSTGFYPVIRNIKDSILQAAWHNFRSADDPMNPSFEDLALVEIYIGD